MRWTASFLFALVGCTAFAAEVQVKTADGQTLQGEYINTENGTVRLRTRFGLLQIPAKDVVTINAAPVGSAPTGTAALPRTEIGARPDDAAAPDVTSALTFPKTKKPDIKALLAKKAQPLPEPNKQDRIELHRLTRNFFDSSERSRNDIVQRLKRYGTTAYPFIAGSYTHPTDLFARVELLHALAVPNSPLTAGIFQDAHQAAMASYAGTIDTPPPPPPDYLSKRDRERLRNGVSAAKQVAGAVLDVENSASIAGGPLNALLLLNTYEQRYDTETSDALLWNIARDQDRLADTANDATKSRGSWGPEDKVLLAEESFPLLFRDDENLKVLPRDLLKKILPSGYPKWDAPQDQWVEWWDHAKLKLLKPVRK